MEDNQSAKANILKKLALKFIPPDRWKIPVLITIGIFFGLGFYIVYISNAVSYLSDNPKTCVNCHVMNPQFATWQRGSHGKVATCNDCHVPQDNLVRKYWFKANDGLRHATYFTMRWEPQVIRIKEAGKKAVQENCIRCHSNLIHPVALRAIDNRNVQDQTERYCWDCHRETPHGRVHSLSSTPHAAVPQLKPVVPEWLEKINNKEN